jgi:hypothetical protein
MNRKKGLKMPLSALGHHFLKSSIEETLNIYSSNAEIPAVW